MTRRGDAETSPATRRRTSPPIALLLALLLALLHGHSPALPTHVASAQEPGYPAPGDRASAADDDEADADADAEDSGTDADDDPIENDEAGDEADAPPISLVLAPPQLVLPGEEGRLRVDVENAPPLRAFQVVLRYDAEALAVTSASAGALIAGADATLTHQVPEPGELRFAVGFEDVPSESRPAGSGSLVEIRLGPLVGEGDHQVEIVSAQLLTGDDETGLSSASAETLTPATVEILFAPEEDALARIQEEAAAFAEAATASPIEGLPVGIGFGDRLEQALDRVAAFEAQLPTLAWVLALLLALFTVALAWLMGRETPASARDANADWRFERD